MRILCAVVAPPSHLAVIAPSEVFECLAVRSQSVGHDHFRPAVAFHRCLEGLKRGFAVARLGDIAFEDLTLMINGSPEVVGFAVDRHEDFVEVQPVLHARAHAINPPHPDLGREHRTKPVP